MRVRRRVADAEGEVVKSWAIVGYDEFEDHPEATRRRWKVDLEALRELGAVAVLGITGAQLRAGHPARFVSALRCFGGIAASWCRSRHVLAEGVGIEASREVRLAGQRLSLAVGGEHVRTMLRQEALPLLLGGIAGAGALLDGLPRGVGHQGERPIRALLGDDVLAGPIAAELDVGELHACNVRRDPASSRGLDVFEGLLATGT